uniref:Uncharacterized protein n=1 Tax=Arundo donax TaxID=35708 RepID=A0A0A9FCW2_ARUDO
MQVQFIEIILVHCKPYI